jgi:uncharacterized delta-60 repeat protein
MLRNRFGRLGIDAALLVAAILVLAVPAAAAPSDLDPSFGDGGFVLTEFASPAVVEPSHARASAIGVQADGKLVAAGSFNDQFGNNGGFALARYTAGGAPDGTFGADGRVITGFPGFTNVQGQAMTLLPDGGIVVGGTALSYATGDVFALARYTADGVLDPSFGSGGRVAEWLGNYTQGGVKALARQTDGKLVAVGTFDVAGSEAIGVARYNANGSLDTTFDSDGLALISSFYYWERPSARAVVVQPDGRIVVAAGLQSAEVVLVRLNADGSLDTSFDLDGIARPRYGQPFALALQPDGKIIEAGQAYGGFSVVVSRVNPDGTSDTSFAGDGTAEVNFLSFDPVAVYSAALSVQIQANGKIVAAGVGDGNTLHMALVRFNPDGTPDLGFGTGGKVLTVPTGATGAQASAVALQADGRIVASGHAYLANGNQVFALARYLGDPTDDVAPVLALPTILARNATSPDGATVDYRGEVSATDNVDGSVAVVCSPASGGLFPIGDTTVSCSATDAAGNSASASFVVHVSGATEQVENLIALVDGYSLGKLGSSLTDKLTTVQRFLAAGKRRQAEENLEAFLAQVDAQRGKGLTQKQSDALGAAGRLILATIAA